MGNAEIIKSRDMTGENSPVVQVGIEGFGGGLGTPTSLVLQGDATINPLAMSRWAEATSKGFLCCFLNASKQLVTGYCADLDFMVNDNAISSKITQIGITTQLSGNGNLDIARLSDGTALLVILDQRNDGAGYYSILKCYKSISGDGGDWSLLSTIHTSAVKASVFSDASEAHIVIDSDGNLFVSANAYNDFSTAVYTAGKIFKSDDDGATWTEELSVGSITGRSRGISQVAFMPDRFWCVLSFPNEANLYKSIDDGNNWTLVEGIKNPTFDAITSNLLQGASMYYEPDSNTALCHIINPFDVGEDGGLFTMDNPTAARLDDLNNFERVSTIGNMVGSGRMYNLGSNVVVQVIQSSAQRIYSMPIEAGVLTDLLSVSVNNALGMAGESTVVFDNEDGRYSYDGSENLHKIAPNKEITIKMGYGAFLETVFKGLIDKMVVKTFPQILTINSRDYSKLAIDGTIIRPTDGYRSFTIYDQTPEQLFATLAGWAGYTDINTDISGISIDERYINWETYADMFGWLCDLTGFDWWVDIDKAINFRKRATNEPRIIDEAHTLIADGSDWSTTLDKTPIFALSDVITNVAGTVTYLRDTDYTIDLATGEVKSIPGGALASGGDILADYTSPRYTFVEGVDITGLEYTIGDADLYYKVVAYGVRADDVEIKATYTLSSAIFGVQENKLLKLDIDGVVTQAHLQGIVDSVGANMRLKPRAVSFDAMGMPDVKVGECVQVIEKTSTVSEIYRAVSVTHTNNGIFGTKIVAGYVGYAPIGG